MHRWVYFALDTGALATALTVGIVHQQSWLKQWKSACLTLFGVMIPFVTWDIWAVGAGHWSFNYDYVLGFTIARLPIEEWLFFIAIPLVSLSIWPLVKPTSIHSSKKDPKFLTSLAGISLASLTLMVVSPHGYSVMAAVTCLVVAVLWLRFPFSFKSWALFHVYMLILFVSANTLLTGLPVVQYGAAHMSGIRFGFIPLEDFFYNFALVSTTIIANISIQNRSTRAKLAAHGTAHTLAKPQP